MAQRKQSTADSLIVTVSGFTIGNQVKIIANHSNVGIVKTIANSSFAVAKKNRQNVCRRTH